MSPEQVAFLARRRRQVGQWPWLAGLLLLVIIAVFAVIWLKAPLQLNPLAILSYFRSGALPDTELVVIAARGSLALIACGLLLLVIVLLLSLSVENERRLIALVDDLSRPAEGGAAAGPDTGEAVAVADRADGTPTSGAPDRGS
jgi:uncharacterized integral membrane protein